MTLLKVLEDPSANPILLSYLQWRDCVSIASVSTQLFPPLKKWVEAVSTDVSLGVSLCPIPCDSVRGRRGKTTAGRFGSPQDWCIGGPVPPTFTYINEAIYPSGEPDSASDLLEGCSCDGPCNDEDGGSSCLCVQLNAAVQSGSAPLFECHVACSCDTACHLRATQIGSGRAVAQMRLRYMGRKGWGAYSIEAIQKGAFVADYTGEMLPAEEARKRMPNYDRDGSNYVLSTQEFFQGGKQVWWTIVDATTCGNVSRFFNHSCEPNLSVFVIRRGSFLPRLAFFTSGRVEAGCELTYDYGATGSAGGALQDDHESLQPTRKAPRQNGPRECSSEDNLDRNGHVSDVAATGLIVCPGANLDGHCHGDGLRRPCLCGSRRCRGLLPCNRVIL